MHFIKNHQRPKWILLFKLKLNMSCCLFNTIPCLTYLIICHHWYEVSLEEVKLQKTSCGRTKTAAIVNCLGDHFFEKLKSDMQEMPYSLMLDGSSGTGLSKTFPMTVRVFDVNFNRVMTNVFDMNLIDGTDASTAGAMFQSIDNQLNNHDIRWDYCLAIGLDNTNVNIGDHNSIKSRANERTEVLSSLVVPAIYYIMHRVKLAKCFLKWLTLILKTTPWIYFTRLTNPANENPYWRNIMSFVTLTIQRLLNLYRRTSCAWKCVLIVNLNNMKA